MLARLSSIDKVSIVALARSIEAEAGTRTISQLAGQLGVPLMSESRNRKGLIERLLGALPDPVITNSPLVGRLVAILCQRSGAIIDNNRRQSYADWFKDVLVDQHLKGASWPELANLTGISLNTLEGFAHRRNPIGARKPISHLHQKLASIWISAAPHHRKNLENFWLHLERRNRDLTITYKEMRQILIDLGLYAQRGPKAANHGAQVKRAFGPHALWEGDAKQIKVSVNGESFTYYWYAFVDQLTTLLVGSTIGPTESSTEFLAALENGAANQKTYPIGVLIDNRLEGSDLGPISAFCSKHRIELLRIFPGNSKTNGNIENNFSIFERQVGSLQINATTGHDIGKALVQAIVEVFTQQRNHRPRKRLADKTPSESAANAQRPESARDAIERMARRFARENRQIEEKWELIRYARIHFGDIEPPSVNKIKAELGKYPVSDVIAAQASYIAQIARYPDRRYGPEYFLAILRYKREEKAKCIYNETYRAGALLASFIAPTYVDDDAAISTAIVDTLISIQDEPTPGHRMLHLDALCWWLMGQGRPERLKALWHAVGESAAATKAMTLRWWAAINEYVTDRIGQFIHCENTTRGPSTDQSRRWPKNNDVTTRKLSDFDANATPC